MSVQNERPAYISEFETQLVTKLGKDPFEQRIKTAIGDLGGLITRDGAICIIARGEGFQIPAPAAIASAAGGDYTAKDLPTMDKEVWLKNARCKLVIMEDVEATTVRSGYNVKHVPVVAGFPCVLVLWEKQASLAFDPQQVVVLGGFKLTEFNGTLQVTPSKYGTFKRLTQAELAESLKGA